MLSILQGDVFERLKDLPNDCVQCVVTSPPYFGLRDYKIPPTIWSDRWTGCLGNEPTPQLFVQHIVDVFREARRVLRPDGVMFLNIGDSYAANRTYQVSDSKWKGAISNQAPKIPPGLKPKDLMLIPERLAIGLQDDGWYIRSRIAWTKSNCMPESTKDRPTSCWEHIWMITKSPTYFWDKVAGLEPFANSSIQRISQGSFDTQTGGEKDYGLTGVNKSRSARKSIENFKKSIEEGTSGRNIRNHWPINPRPLKEAHFATFPVDLPHKAIVVATSEKGCCPACRAPWKRIAEKGDPDAAHQALCGADSTGSYAGTAQKDYASAKAQDPSATKARILAGMVKKVTVGWLPTCSCPHNDPIPCLVLDPFSGAGTTLLAAEMLGRDAVGIELNPDYVDIAKKRLDTEVWDVCMW